MPEKPSFYILSSLAKVFQKDAPCHEPECNAFTALKGETVSFQGAYFAANDFICRGRIKATSPIGEFIRIREVLNIPSTYPGPVYNDGNYITVEPGMFPDLLRDMPEDGGFILPAMQWKAFWVDVEIGENTPAGKHPITLTVTDENGKELASASTTLTVYDVVLPPQTMLHTQWFHTDCLADYYNIEVFSERHWEIVENFIAGAVKRGINMILTPQFTPPLDTMVGGERTTNQLIDVSVDKGAYTFGFEKLKRWVDICERNGVKAYEMSHLFTQWGATAAPKVMAIKDGVYGKLFGWETPAVGGEYTRFLEAYLPQLTAHLKEWGVADKVWFHISDEPSSEQLESYKAAKDSIAHLIEGFKGLDALSSLEIYETGAVEVPVCANDHIHVFLEKNISPLWCYYCVAQNNLVSNRFVSMPSARNRIYGIQLYKFRIDGILHWGYNFYNSQFSLRHLNPYEVTDCDGAFPSGDAYLVYPGADGMPEESIRMMVQYEAMSDLRALKLLESLTSYEYVVELLEEDLAEPITFTSYPTGNFYITRLRNRVNKEIAQRIAK